MMSKEFPSMTESIEAHQEMMAETTSTAWTEFVGKLRSEVAELATLRAQNQELRVALDTLVAVVALTAFKHETQRAVLQEAVDGALKIIGEVER